MRPASYESLPAMDDALGQSGSQTAILDEFTSDDILARWTVAAPSAAVEAPGIPAVVWTIGAAQELTLMHQVGLWNTSVPSRCLMQARIKVSASAPKVMIGMMAVGAAPALVVDGIWLEKAASATTLTVKGARSAASAGAYQSVAGSGSWPSSGFVDASLWLVAFPGALECVAKINGMEVGRISVSGLEAGVSLRPHVFVGASCDVSLSQFSLRTS